MELASIDGYLVGRIDREKDMINRKLTFKNVIQALQAYIVHDFDFLLMLGGLTFGTILASALDSSSLAYLGGFCIGIIVGVRLND